LKDLAEQLGISAQSINAWEAEIKPIPAARLEKLTEIFGLDGKYFVPDISAELQILVRIDLLFQSLPDEWRDEALTMIRKRMTEGEK